MMQLLPKLAVQGLQFLWRRGQPAVSTLTPGRVRDLIEDLRNEKQGLESFTATLEDEFLLIGGQLRNITSLARQVRERSDEVLNAIAGRAEGSAIDYAFQLLKKAEDLVLASREQYDGAFEVFEHIQSELRGMESSRIALTRTISSLQTNNLQFRIQACGFEETIRREFFDLADTIGEVVDEVQTAVGESFEELERTGRTSGNLVLKLIALAAEQQAETERVLVGTRTHLSDLNNALLSSESAAQSVSETGARIASGVGMAIVALQCQDMARQKFQHIGNAIDHMIEMLEGGSQKPFNRTEEADARHYTTDAANVQLRQLQLVFAQLDEAARQVSAGMADVEKEATAFAACATRAAGAVLDGQITGRAIESIHSILRVTEKAVGNIGSVLALVHTLKSTFSDCTSQIVDLTITLRLVALNAQILAAHVDEGTALEVVARNTRNTGDVAMGQLGKISADITLLVESVVHLDLRLGDYLQLSGIEKDCLARESAESETKLRLLEARLRGALSALTPLEKQLSEAVRSAAQSITFPGAVATANSRSTAFFEQVSSDYTDSRTVGSAHHKVEELKRNYTMAHERVVHASALGTGAAGNATVPAGQETGTGDEELWDLEPPEAAEVEVREEIVTQEDNLGDNVELF